MIRIACGLARPGSSLRCLVFVMVYHPLVKDTEWAIRVETLKTASEGVIYANGMLTLRVTTYRAQLRTLKLTFTAFSLIIIVLA